MMILFTRTLLRWWSYLIRKGSELFTKEIIAITGITRWLNQNLDIEALLLFHSIKQISHLLLIKSLLLIILTFYNPRSFLVTLIFQLLLKSLLPSLFGNPIILFFSLGITYTPHSCFFHRAHKPSASSSPVKNVSSFLLIQLIALFLEFDLVLKNHSKSHIY